ncbi:MAG: MarR family transcriptional regulator [Hyphomicrobiales bacterium]|nr:MarR family transcriptional regulator [Hyphomicrobiales bacterium]
MKPKAETAALAEIVRLVPLVFHRLRAVGDGLHAERGITTPMRGVMASLFDAGPQTVPQMAAARPVSRQHIQTLVDALAERGLVESRPNPAHKRSSLIELTEAGHDLFLAMREAELAVLQEHLAGFQLGDLDTAREVLSTLAERLDLLVHSIKENRNDPA